MPTAAPTTVLGWPISTLCSRNRFDWPKTSTTAMWKFMETNQDFLSFAARNRVTETRLREFNLAALRPLIKCDNPDGLETDLGHSVLSIVDPKIRSKMEREYKKLKAQEDSDSDEMVKRSKGKVTSHKRRGSGNINIYNYSRLAAEEHPTIVGVGSSPIKVKSEKNKSFDEVQRLLEMIALSSNRVDGIKTAQKVLSVLLEPVLKEHIEEQEHDSNAGDCVTSRPEQVDEQEQDSNAGDHVTSQPGHDTPTMSGALPVIQGTDEGYFSAGLALHKQPSVNKLVSETMADKKFGTKTQGEFKAEASLMDQIDSEFLGSMLILFEECLLRRQLSTAAQIRFNKAMIAAIAGGKKERKGVSWAE